MVDITGIVSMIGWGIQNPGSALAAVISMAVVAAAVGYIVDGATPPEEGVRLGGRRPAAPSVAEQLQNIWQQRGAHLRRAVEETNVENRAAAAA